MLPPNALFERAFECRIGPRAGTTLPPGAGIDVSKLRVEFHIRKTLRHEPNTCELKIHNLTEKNRTKLSKGALAVSLSAGYAKAGTSLLYLGEVRSAYPIIEGPNVITHLSSGDGEAVIQKTRINVPVGPFTPAAQVLATLAGALKLSGNIDQASALLLKNGVVTFHPKGGVLAGNAARILTDLCRSAELAWSIQDGVLQIVDRKAPLAAKAIVLGPETGLVESPSVDSKGFVNAKCLIIPGLRPGRIVVLKSAVVKGAYRLEEVEYVGDTYGADWHASIVCKKW